MEYKHVGNVSEVVKRCSCHLYRKIVAEYEKTVAQMIGELVPPSGHYLHRWFDLLQIYFRFWTNVYLLSVIALTLLSYFIIGVFLEIFFKCSLKVNTNPNFQWVKVSLISLIYKIKINDWNQSKESLNYYLQKKWKHTIGFIYLFSQDDC